MTVTAPEPSVPTVRTSPRPVSVHRTKASRRLSGDQAGPGNLDLKTAGVGRPMLVNVFASWCAPCRIEHPKLLALKARGVNVTRLARGVPVGSELEYVDLGTIAHALVDRR